MKFNFYWEESNLYSIEEIKEIIDDAVLEECKNYNDSSSIGYIGVQSLKTRLYDAFGIEDVYNDAKLIRVKIVKISPTIGTVTPWYRDEIGKIYTVLNQKVDLGIGSERMCYPIVEDGVPRSNCINCCDCEIID